MRYSNRRKFIKQLAGIAGSAMLGGTLFSCLPKSEKNTGFDFRISLAEWSLHKALFSGQMTNLDFPRIARERFGIGAVEYVNQFFMDKAKDTSYLNQLKQVCLDHEVVSLLIMVDQEGPLSDKNPALRRKAVESHYKWVEAAKYLDCHSIRVNLHGEGNAEEWKKASIESLSALTEFAEKIGMNILAENHGGFSSHAGMLTEVLKEVGRKRCMALVDFANFCVRREKGDLWESPCVDWYDRYKGVEELLPYAKGVSAKSFAFDKDGNETTTDFRKMLKLVKDSGFRGYIGVEYEGSELSEDEGILANKKLLERIRDELS